MVCLVLGEIMPCQVIVVVLCGGVHGFFFALDAAKSAAA